MALASALNVKPTRKTNGMAVDHHVVPPGKGLKPTAPVDPFAPMSPRDINRTVNGFVGMYGAPQTDGQIQATAQGEINPIIAAITKNATDRATASSAAIKGITGSYAKELAGIDFTSPYKQAEGDQAAVDSALQQTLAGAGSDLASQLKARLGMLNDPAVAQTASGLESRGAATGATQVAQGSNALSALIAAAAAAGSYGQKLPALARLSGIQGVEQANSQAANDVASGTQTALGQLPSIVNALRSDNSSLRGNRANAAANEYNTLTGQNITKATAKAGLAGDRASLDYQYANAAADSAASAASTAERTRHDKAIETTAAKKATGTGKTFTPAQVAKFKGVALTIATQAKTGAPAVLDAKGNVKDPALPKLTRHQAILEMEKEGVPEKIAIATADRVYGKPLTPAQKKKQARAVATGVGIPALTTADSAAGH